MLLWMGLMKGGKGRDDADGPGMEEKVDEPAEDGGTRLSSSDDSHKKNQPAQMRRKFTLLSPL